MVVVVDRADAKATVDAFNARGAEAFEIGAIAERAAGAPQVQVA
jgi:phosphoribosylaminoimidazole (AIR) synthetase